MEPGQRFTRLITIEPAPKQGKRTRWVCQCDCGTKVIVLTGNLGTGTKSCGCLRLEMTRKSNLIHGEGSKHGGKVTPEYQAWISMRGRCNNPNSRNFPRYGGRNIQVCDRWKYYENFLADMGRLPSARHTLDRINVDGNYAPENCRWATRREQANNRRNNIRYGGKTLSEWSRETGIKYHTLYRRMNYQGMSIETALTRG